ncbi:MAG: hypothetical protein HY074_02900 [Deltaproteobacteria bacterium]|nr:hypothetical protein [Deltaproteobacteria bacterium]
MQANAVAASRKHQLAHGEAVKLQFGDETAMADAVFLGRLVPLDGVATELAFYELGRQLVHVIPISKISIKRVSGEDVDVQSSTPVVRSINQEGGTCAAFSMFNCMRQMHLFGQDGNDVMKAELATEAGRMGLLVRIVNQLYIENQNTTTVIANLTTKYGFKSYEIPWSNGGDLQEGLLKYLGQGWPVLLRFDVPKDMTVTDYTIIDRSNAKNRAGGSALKLSTRTPVARVGRILQWISARCFYATSKP